MADNTKRQFLSMGVALVSAAVAIASAIVAVRAREDANDAAVIQVFLELRRDYNIIQKELPTSYRKKGWVPEENTGEWTALEAYWTQSYNEWLVTNRLLDGKYNHLWETYYSSAILSSLRHDSMRAVFCHMATRYFVLEYSKDFRNDLEILYLEDNDRAVCE